MPTKRKNIKLAHKPQSSGLAQHIIPFIIFATSFAMAMLFTSEMTSAMSNLVSSAYQNQISIGSDGPGNDLQIETAIATTTFYGNGTMGTADVYLNRANLLSYQIFVATVSPDTISTSTPNGYPGESMTELGTYGCMNQVYPLGFMSSRIFIKCISSGPSDPIPPSGAKILVRYYYAAGNSRYCGDAVVTGGESCDEGYQLNGQVGHCNATCSGRIATPAVCGNGVREQGESCDEGSLNGTAGHCNTTCNGTTPSPVCGNGVREATEVCDDGSVNGQIGHCNLSCTGYKLCPADFSAGQVNTGNGNESGCLSTWRKTGELSCAVQCSSVATQYPNNHYSCYAVSTGSYGCFGYPIESATSTGSTALKSKNNVQ